MMWSDNIDKTTPMAVLISTTIDLDTDVGFLAKKLRNQRGYNPSFKKTIIGDKKS